MPPSFTIEPRGAFDLAQQREHFGGWPAYPPDPDALAMTFPVEGWRQSATVVLRQPEPATITGEVFSSGITSDAEGAAAGPAAGAAGAAGSERPWQQALAVLSLDVDGSGFAGVADRDAVMAELLLQHRAMRPVLFHSPYEAACNFVIGQRISIVQARAIRARMAEEHGDHVEAGGVAAAAFPRPQVLLELDEVRSLAAEKLHRLHGIARAALDGVLDRARLRGLATGDALAQLEALHGVGPFSAQGILYRGAGLVDEIPDDQVTKQAVQRRYGFTHLPTHDQVLEVAEAWRPYRMWCLVLLHVWLRGEGGGPDHGERRRSAAR